MTHSSKAAARGAEYLDRKVPGWYLGVDMDTVDMRDEGRCMAAQVFGHYWKLPIFDLVLTDSQLNRWTRLYGFNPSPLTGWLLKRAWGREVDRRLVADHRVGVDRALAEIADINRMLDRILDSPR